MIYIESNSTSASYNFALEYYFFTEKHLGDDVFLFWRTEPTVMLGRYQNAMEEFNADYIKKTGTRVVRRVTGGGTIYTDLNGWQYSFISETGDMKTIDFKRFVMPMIEALNSLGVSAEFKGRNDLLIDGKKISGNAQCIKRSFVLHHGSLLFNTDLDNLIRCTTVKEEKIISRGIKSVRERVTNVAEHLDRKMDAIEFRDAMLEYLLKDVAAVYTLTEADLTRIKRIQEEKFENWDWNYGASPDFDIVRSGWFTGGGIEIRMNVRGGRIKECKFSGDFFDAGDIGQLQLRLAGCRYLRDELKERLEKIEAEKYFFGSRNSDILNCMIG